MPQLESSSGAAWHRTLRFVPNVLVVAWASAPLIAQTPFPEIEPNSRKFEATPADCLVPGDFLTGVTTGALLDTGDPSLASVDTFRVRTCLLPFGVYRHVLVLTTSGSPGHTGTLRGLNQTGIVGLGGVAGVLDVAVQTSTPTTTPPRITQWYGFGKGEQVYYRVEGTAATSSPYLATLSTFPVTPTPIGPFQAGFIAISTVGQGHEADTEVALFNANLSAMPLFLNDDEFGAATPQSKLTRVLLGGTYYLAVTNSNYADTRVAPVDDDSVLGNLMDFPNSGANSSASSGMGLSFAVTDFTGTTPVAASKSSPFEVVWFKLTIDPPPSTPGFNYCEPGTLAVNSCPCGNNPIGPGRGCDNSSITGGATLTDVGTASLASDTVVFTTAFQKPEAISLVLQSRFDNGTGSPFGDGIRCGDGLLKRLYVKNAVGGSITAPQGPDPSVSARSAAVGDPIAPGSYRQYQVFYRDPFPFACAFGPGGATFNVTVGRVVLWNP